MYIVPICSYLAPNNSYNCYKVSEPRTLRKESFRKPQRDQYKKVLCEQPTKTVCSPISRVDTGAMFLISALPETWGQPHQLSMLETLQMPRKTDSVLNPPANHNQVFLFSKLCNRRVLGCRGLGSFKPRCFVQRKHTCTLSCCPPPTWASLQNGVFLCTSLQ